MRSAGWLNLGLALLLAGCGLLTGCGGGSSSSGAAVGSGSGDSGSPGGGTGEPPAAAVEVRALVTDIGLDGDPSDGLSPVRPADDPLVDLGLALFYSRTLSGRMDVSCASCHQPGLGGGDGLSLPIGVAAEQPELVGLGRMVDQALDFSADADGTPNVPRNSQTIFNVALYSRALFHDGRVFVVDDETVQGGFGQQIRTPESGNLPDLEAGGSLLQAQSLFPLVSHDEMRGYMYPEITDPDAYRDRLVQRLRGEADTAYLSPEAAQNWQARFSEVFGDGEPVITIERIQVALEAYQRSQIFVDAPWKAFVAGDDSAITEQALQGASLFFKPVSEGGLGCAGCHSGDFFTDEQFHNVGFPQFGRGKQVDGADLGRAQLNLDQRSAADNHAFRTPSLWNVALTAPYGHVGGFADLDSLLRYHADPVTGLASYAFDLRHLPQTGDRDARNYFPEAEQLSIDLQDTPSFASALEKLPRRPLLDEEVSALTAFLESLTDVCASDADCRSAWLPDEGDNPDGNLFLAGVPFPAGPLPQPGGYLDSVVLSTPTLPGLSSFPDMDSCTTNTMASNDAEPGFRQVGLMKGLILPQAFSLSTWMGEDLLSTRWIMPTMFAGGIAATYLDDDCYPDLVFASGDIIGVQLYRNRGGQLGFLPNFSLFGETSGRYASVGVADIDGDFRREVLLGNLHPGVVTIAGQDGDGDFNVYGQLPMDRNTYGMAFGMTGVGSHPSMYFSHWGDPGVPGRSPALWRNDGALGLSPIDQQAGVAEGQIDQRYHFSPGFVDADEDGHQDLLIASDFGTSLVLRNNGAGQFDNVTDRDVITDEFGMGAAIADFDNDGKLDWFVTSVGAPEDDEETRNCATRTGNRLYRNVSTPGDIRFEDVTATAGVAEGGWGWAACAADFNNDGSVDIFHVNGFALDQLPDIVKDTGEPPENSPDLCLGYSQKRPRLFINNGSGVFQEKSLEWGIDYGDEGRGVTCLDYDRDGDMDIVSVDNSRLLNFLENRTGHGAGRRFVTVRLAGLPPNTEALGARVYVTADVNGDGQLSAGETQLRASAANSNFASQNANDLHFGLGAAATISSVRIVWPDGQERTCNDIAVNSHLVFRQSEGGGRGLCP